MQQKRHLDSKKCEINQIGKRSYTTLAIFRKAPEEICTGIPEKICTGKDYLIRYGLEQSSLNLDV